MGTAIAYNVWQYFQVTHDVEFLQFHGAELIPKSPASGRASPTTTSCGPLRDPRVMGPDEFHEGYPVCCPRPASKTTPTPTSWPSGCCSRRSTCSICSPTSAGPSSRARLGLSGRAAALGGDQPQDISSPSTATASSASSRATRTLEELDWEAYRTRYGNIHSLDRILEAEGDSPNRYKLSKQADVLMLFYLFSAEELPALRATGLPL